jgi:hypothetical protein
MSGSSAVHQPIQSYVGARTGGRLAARAQGETAIRLILSWLSEVSVVRLGGISEPRETTGGYPDIPAAPDAPSWQDEQM